MTDAHARRGLALAALVAFAACSSPETAPRAAAETARAPDPITAEELRAHVAFLADDALEGRMTGEPGCERAALYVAEQFARMGLEPGGDRGPDGRTYLQHFVATSGRRLEATSRVELGGRALAIGSDCAVANGVGTSLGEGELLFAGFGLRAPELGRDDYAGLEVAGRIVVVVDGAPGRARGEGEFVDTRPGGRHARARSKIDAAFAQQAAGMVIVANPLEPQPAQVLPEWQSDRGEGLSFAAVHVTAAAGRELLAQAGIALDEVAAALDGGALQSRALDGLPGAIRIDTSPIRRPTANVVGILRGPAARGDDHAIVGAHYDHLGLGGSGSLSGERAIHNGADDNASGTAALIEVAQACATAAAPPAATLVFIAFSGEELGLLGSQHYTANPLLPLDRCFGMLNMDMVGRSRNGYCAVGAVGSSPGFAETVRRIHDAGAFGLSLEISDGGMARGSSDHQAFLNASVPSLFFFSGLHEDYHKPSDDTERVNFDGAASIARLCHGVLEEIAALPQRPEFVAAAPQPSPHGADAPARPSGGRPWFGSVPSFGDSGEGVLFDGVTAGSPAEKAGIRKGDRLVEWNGRPVKTLEDFTAHLSAAQVGDVIRAGLMRDGSLIHVEVTLAIRP